MLLGGRLLRRALFDLLPAPWLCTLFVILDRLPLVFHKLSAVAIAEKEAAVLSLQRFRTPDVGRAGFRRSRGSSRNL